MLSWNRKDDVIVSLTHLFESNYPSREVIVVDNHSTDGTVDMVREKFPSVIVIPLPENIGIAGWNKGFEIARGEFILVLDDDSYPGKESLATAVDRMKNEPRCGVLALQVYNIRRRSVQTSSLVAGENTTFVGCGAVLRKEVLRIAGMFEPLLFLYMHEEEFAMRVINAGYTVLYEPAAIVQHISSPSHRSVGAASSIDVRRQYYLIRNILVILSLHFSVRHLMLRIPRIVIGRILFGLKSGCLLPILKGIWSFVRDAKAVGSRRSVLSDRTQALYHFGSFAGGFFFSD